MPQAPTAFQIDAKDNVATALGLLPAGAHVGLRGDAAKPSLDAVDEVPAGHKIALRDIDAGEGIVKYGVPIGRATAFIRKGGWVHLHCMGSNFDEKSNKLDPATGTSADTRY